MFYCTDEVYSMASQSICLYQHPFLLVFNRYQTTQKLITQFHLPWFFLG